MSQDLIAYFPVDRFGAIVAQDGVPYGMSGATVRAVTTTRGSYILRLYHGDQATWERTLMVHRLVAEQGIAPPLLHVDEHLRATVSQKITGPSFGAALAQAESQQAAMASLTTLLAKLHALPIPALPLPVLPPSSPLVFAQELWTSQLQRPGFPVWTAPLSSQLISATQTLTGDNRQVLSHGDLNPANILWDGSRVWFVDWDRASLCHPYLDLATLCNFISLPDEAALALLARQEQAVISSDQQLIFKAWREVSRIVYGCVFLRLIPDLTQVTFASKAMTPTLSQCFGLMVAGELSMATIAGQAKIGAAFLKQDSHPDPRN